MHYTSDAKSGNWLQKAVKRNLTLNGLMDKLLKKTVKRNTWIYASVSKNVQRRSNADDDIPLPKDKNCETASPHLN